MSSADSATASSIQPICYVNGTFGTSTKLDFFVMVLNHYGQTVKTADVSEEGAVPHSELQRLKTSGGACTNIRKSCKV
jgi:hypothetical protein